MRKMPMGMNHWWMNSFGALGYFFSTASSRNTPSYPAANSYVVIIDR